jgi:uncharacterized membrane protein YdjX (TVP38/TMEM64 family)
MKKDVSKNIRNILLVILSFGIPIALIIIFRHDFKHFERLIPTLGILGPLLSVLLMGILSATPIPTDSIVILNGALFGPLMGVIVSWFGNSLACVIEYYIGRGLGEVTDFEKTKANLPFGLGRFRADSVWFLLFGRLVPQFGGKIVSLAAGFYRVSMFRYLWTAFLSNLLGSLLLAYGGYSLLHL